MVQGRTNGAICFIFLTLDLLLTVKLKWLTMRIFICTAVYCRYSHTCSTGWQRITSAATLICCHHRVIYKYITQWLPPCTACVRIGIPILLYRWKCACVQTLYMYDSCLYVCMNISHQSKKQVGKITKKTQFSGQILRNEGCSDHREIS